MTKVKVGLGCLLELLKKDPLVKLVEELPSKESAELNVIYMIPKQQGDNKRAYVVRPDRSGFDTIDLSPKEVNVVGEDLIDVAKEEINSQGETVFTVKASQKLKDLLKNQGNGGGGSYDDSQVRSEIGALTTRVNVLEEAKPLVEGRLTALESKEDNDKQTLSLNGNVLSISNGNSVTLPSVSSQPSQPPQPPQTSVINVTPTFNSDSITFDTQGFVKGFEYTLGCNATIHAKGQENNINKSYKVGTHLHTLVNSSNILVHYGSEHTIEVLAYFDGNNTLNYVLRVTYLNEVFTKVFTESGDNTLVAEINVDSHELKDLSCNVTLSLSEIRGEG